MSKIINHFRTWCRCLPLIFVIVLMIIAFAQGWHKQLSLTALIENRIFLGKFVEENIILMLAGFTVLYVSVVTLSIPASAFLTISGGFLFGWLLGSVFTLISATTGAILLFTFIKTALGTNLRVKAGPWITKLAQGFQQNSFYYLLFLRLVPVAPFWLVNVVPAILGMRLNTYIVATFLGIIPGTIAFALIGSGLDSVIDAQRKANMDCIIDTNCPLEISTNDLITPQLLIAFTALAIVALIPIGLKKFMNKKLTAFKH